MKLGQRPATLCRGQGFATAALPLAGPHCTLSTSAALASSTSAILLHDRSPSRSLAADMRRTPSSATDGVRCGLTRMRDCTLHAATTRWQRQRNLACKALSPTIRCNLRAFATSPATPSSLSASDRVADRPSAASSTSVSGAAHTHPSNRFSHRRRQQKEGEEEERKLSSASSHSYPSRMDHKTRQAAQGRSHGRRRQGDSGRSSSRKPSAARESKRGGQPGPSTSSAAAHASARRGSASSTAPPSGHMKRQERVQENKPHAPNAREGERQSTVDSGIATEWGSAVDARELRQEVEQSQTSAPPSAMGDPSSAPKPYPTAEACTESSDVSGTGRSASTPAHRHVASSARQRVYTNTTEPNLSALWQLLRDHKTMYQNYKTLKESKAVLDSVEDLCARALAEGRLVEQLAAVFSHGLRKSRGRSAKPSEELSGASPQAQPASTRLLLTRMSSSAHDRQGGEDVGVAAHVSSPSSSAASTTDAMAELVLPAEALPWLRSPIQLPPLTAAEMMTAVEAMVSRMRNEKCHGEAALSSSTDESEAAQDTASDPLHLLYRAWGRQQAELYQTQQQLAASQTPSAPLNEGKAEGVAGPRAVRAPSVMHSMSAWYRLHCDVSEVLQRCFLKKNQSYLSRPSLLGARSLASTADADVRRAQQSWDRAGLEGGGEGETTRPDQAVEDMTRLLLVSLGDLLQTLIQFKEAHEGARLTKAAVTSTVPTTQAPSPAALLSDLRSTIQHLREWEVANVARSADADALSDSTASGSACGEACQQVSDLAQQLLRTVSCVDVLQLTAPLCAHSTSSASPEDDVAAALSGVQTKPATEAGISRSCCYSVAALDLLIGLLLRCLVFYLPALPQPGRRRVLQVLRSPWLRHKQSICASLWLTYFGLTEALTQIASLPATSTVAAGSSQLATSAFWHLSHVLSMLMYDLRALCWPTVIEYNAGIVQQALQLPPEMATANAEKRSTPFTNRGESAHLWRSLVVVLQSNEQNQSAGYDLLLFVFAVLDRADCLGASSPLFAGFQESADALAAPSDARDDTTAQQRRQGRSNHAPRRIRGLYLSAIDIDRYITDRLRLRHQAASTTPLLSPTSVLLPSERHLPTVASDLPCVRLCVFQSTAYPYALTRLAYCALHMCALSVWPSMSHTKGSVLWDAFRCSVVVPSAAALRARVCALPEDGRAAAAQAAAWQAAVPVLQCFQANMTKDVWAVHWSYVAAELAAFPPQMGLMLQSEKTAHTAKGAAVATHDALSRIPAADAVSQSREEGERGAVASALQACWKQLTELAMMCAWLTLAAEDQVRRESARSAGVLEEAGAAEQMAHVTKGFASCVEAMLAVWSQMGMSTEAAGQLLELFPRLSAVDGAERSRDGSTAGEAPPSEALLTRLTQSARRFVWTATLGATVQEWVDKTQLVHQRTLHMTSGASSNSGSSSHRASTSVEAAAVTAAEKSAGALDADQAEGNSRAADVIDPSLVRWWTSLQAEEVGLPFEHLYLLNVFVELKRIVLARVALRGAGTAAQREESNAELVRDAADTSTSKTAGVLFSCTELTILLRALSSISVRGGLTTAASFVGASAASTASSAHTSSTLTANAATTDRAGSILDTLYRVALHHTLSSATTGEVAAAASRPPKDSGVQAAASTAATVSAASSEAKQAKANAPTAETPTPAAAVEAVVREIEQALLSSVRHHASTLSAASLLEAVWLGLCPLASLGEARQHAASASCPEEATPLEPPPQPTEAGVTVPLWTPSTLPLVSSKWYQGLHTSIHESRHTRSLCSLFLYRHYDLLAMADDEAAGRRRINSAHANDEASNSQVSESPTEAAQLSALSAFLVCLRGSCVGALMEESKRASAERDAPAVSEAERAAMTSHGVEQTSAVTASTPTSPKRGAMAVVLKEQAAHFSQVFLLASALHHLLSSIELSGSQSSLPTTTRRNTNAAAQSTNAAVYPEPDTLSALYAALLDAVEAFIPFAERGYCTEVLQLVSMITWRMRKLHVLLPPMGDDATKVIRRAPASTEGTLTRSEVPRAGVEASSSERAAPFPAQSREAELLFRFRAAVQRLMPFVDTEVLANTKGSTPLLQKLAVIISAKSALAHALRGVPDATAASLRKTTVSAASHNPADSPVSAETVTELPDAAKSAPPDRAVDSFAALTSASKPLWSHVPLESLFYRVASDRWLAVRNGELLCSLALAAPDLSTALLPLAGGLRYEQHGFATSHPQLVFLSLATCAVAYDRQNQQELLTQASSSFVSLSTDTAAGSDESHTPPSGVEHPRRTGGLVSQQRLSTSSAVRGGNSIRVGEMQLASTSGGGALPLFRSFGIPATKRTPPPQLRQAWAALARCLLESEHGSRDADQGSDERDAGDPAVWVAALYCGAMVGCAETHLFEQLLACLVFNAVPTKQPKSIVEAIHGQPQMLLTGAEMTRAAKLQVMEWVLLLQACATATDPVCRQAYQALLKDQLVSFLNASHDGGSELTSSPLASATTREALCVRGPVLCALLESMALLFIDDDAFWHDIVQRAVEGWCTQLMPDLSEWHVQWRRSFNWAVKSAGHATLAFPDLWTSAAEAAAKEEAVQRMEASLRRLC